MAEIPPLGEMNLDDFRRTGHQLIDWVAAYLAHPEACPVLSRSRPGEIKAQLPDAPPAGPESMDDILADFENIIMPGITHWNHPGFFAYFGITGSAPGILGELLTAALDVNAMLWRTSPAATELEETVLDWFRQMLGLSAAWDGVMTDGASASSLIAMAAARQSLPNLHIRVKGLAGRADMPRLRVYISDQTHSSVEKAAITLGVGQENVVKIESDEAFQMKPAALETAVSADLAAGYRPFFVCATVGTTSSTSIDPVPAVAAIARKFNLWLHVDGAYGGAAAIVPEKRYVLAGVEQADSLVVNPHKWLFTPLDLSTFFTRHPDIVRRAFSLLPEYLRSAETDARAVKDYMDYGVQLGRRFRALKLWMVIRTYGVDGLAARLTEHMRLARQFAGWVDDSAEFERMAPVPFSVVCFRAHPAGMDDEAALERLNHKLIEAVNATGEVFMSHTKLRGRYTVRLAIGNIRTEAAHVKRAWELCRAALQSMPEAE